MAISISKIKGFLDQIDFNYQMKDEDTTLRWALWFLAICGVAFIMNVLQLVFA